MVIIFIGHTRGFIGRIKVVVYSGNFAVVGEGGEGGEEQ